MLNPPDLQPIGIIHSCYPEKFGIPRQPGLVKSATARLEMLAPFNRPEMFKGLDRFSHIWLQFIFHETLAEGWRATIRPPWLGGRERVGIFASRSPHRPNHLGLSVVRLIRIVREGKGIFCDLAEIDLLDQTPVIDIKPYIPYSDRILEASDGYTLPAGSNTTAVVFSEQARDFCRRYEMRTGRKLYDLVCETLSLDPRPASHRARTGEYGTLFWDINVRWQVEADGFLVLDCAEKKGRTDR
ncbi:MAG: tRNA (N6-threonylcarbamoyladenosine(37)-N6)-methyltransferase TrmO [Desulfocapsaceae bacterium]|nr:tRNA (N6-threonylcarbamoyladenosine(37)-N6)-methyltransferase TrmO [Desulfocapsaceae bacterium]